MLTVDIHHHFFPPRLNKAKSGFSETLAWTTPPENTPWTPETSIMAMDKLGINFAFLSIPALVTTGNNSKQVREDNTLAWNICQKYPKQFGWFAALPNLEYIEDALNEIAYAMDVLGADGIALPSSFGYGPDAKYLGHDSFEPIWAELDKRGAVVFVHGTQTASTNTHPHEQLGIPIVEVPNETFKAAASLVVSGRKRRYPNVRIILSHLGGTMPVLSSRVAVLSSYMGCQLSPEDILDDFKTFWFDTALGGTVALAAVDALLGPKSSERILFGTDFPAVSTNMVDQFTDSIKGSREVDDLRLRAILRGNALNLFPRLAKLLTSE